MLLAVLRHFVHVLALRAHLPHRMQGLGILRRSNRRDICYAKSVAATFGTNMQVSDHALGNMLTVALKLGVITQADPNDQDDDDVSDAFIERLERAWTLQCEERWTSSLPKKKRSFVVLLLTTSAADNGHHPGADCQAKPKPNPHCRGGFPVLAGHRHGV